jgi:hypothetical protein
VELDRHESDGASAHLRYPYSPLFSGADVLYSPPLIFPPVRVLAPENIGTQHLLK